MHAHERSDRGGDPAELEHEKSSQSSDRATIADPRAHFYALSRDEQRDAIKRLALDGMSDYGIASATKLSVEMVRTILGERPA